MKKLNLLFVLSILIFTSSIAKAQSWGYATYGHWIADVNEDPAGNIWTIGYGGEDPLWTDAVPNYVVKLSPDGELLWKGAASIPWAAPNANAILPTADGGAVVVLGFSYPAPAFYKLDAAGTLLWDNSAWIDSLGFTYDYSGYAAILSDGRIITGGLSEDLNYHFIEMDNDGNLLSTFTVAADTSGWAWSYFDYKETGMVATADGGFAFSAGVPGARTLYKFNSSMAIEWQQAYPHPGYWEYTDYGNGSLIVTDDGGYLMCSTAAPDGVEERVAVLRKIASDGTLEWENYYTGIPNTSGTLIAQLDADNYIFWPQDVGNNSSHGWVTDLDGNITDSLFIPVINCTWGVGETGMELLTAKKYSGGGYLIAGRQWLEDCDQRYTILKSEADGSFAPCIFNCVWPGDANNDGTDDATDLFEIGINYGATGYSRTDTATDWSGKLSRAWMEPDTLYWYVLNDLKYADCNGDGIINDNDTTAISMNFGLEHPLNTLRETAGDIPLYFKPESDSLQIGLNEIPIMLGDDINSVDEIYGITFTITVTGDDIDASSLKVNFTDSWLSASASRLSISKTDGANKLVVSALVRKDRNNTAGYGEIGTLGVVVIDNISGKTTSDDVTFAFSNVTAIKLNRDIVSLAPENLTFPVTTGINDLYAAGINIYPNPVLGDNLFIDAQNKIQSLQLCDITGKILIVETDNLSGKNALDISNFAAGNYLLKINTGDNIITQKILIQ